MSSFNREISIFNPCVSNFGSIKSLFRHYEINTIPVTVGERIKTKSVLICGVSGLQFDDKEYLQKLRNWIQSIHDEGKQVVGICAGMQMLFKNTDEVEEPLIGLLNGAISKLNFDTPNVLTFIGYRQLNFSNLNSNESFRCYFAHGYGLIKSGDIQFDEEMLYQINQKESGIAYFKKNNILGFQFHPEKSAPETREFFINKLELGYAN